MRRLLPFLITILVAAALAGTAATYAVDAVERKSADDVRAALDDAGIAWAGVEADGLRIDLSGTAPDEATRFRAVKAAGSAVDGDRVIDGTEVTSREGIAPPTFSVEILRQTEAVTMIGLIPAATDREAVARAVSRAVPETQVTDLLEVASYPAPEGWSASVAFGLETLERLDRAKVSITAGKVAITALAADEAARDKLARDLRRLAPRDVTLALDLSAPRPVIAPFILRVVKADGAARFDACSAAGEAGAATILDAARQAGIEVAEGGACTLGLGVPSPEWPGAASAAIAAIGALDEATLTMSDLTVTLEAAAGTDGDLFSDEVAQLEQALPPEFDLAASIREAGAVDPEAGPAEFTATRDAKGAVRLSGRLATERSVSAVESFAKALYGVESVTAEMDVAEPVPTGWAPRVLASLDALSILEQGTVTVREEDIAVSGVSGIETATAEISRILSVPPGTTPRFEIDVRYDAEIDAEQAPPTPQDCVDRVMGVLDDRQITFSPGSADIDTESRPSVDAIAEILRDCDGVAMEVAGYTDSQGSEEMNRTLSRSRAEAVLIALTSRRVLTSALEAEGYGEDDPIADNATPEGREANRRIEFRLIAAAEGQTEGDGTEGEEAEDDQTEAAGDDAPEDDAPEEGETE